jgi:hypothetical protein
MKFIEIKDLSFCSNGCLEKYINTMGHKKFNQQYRDYFVSGQTQGWVPKYANDYMKMCTVCPKNLSESCMGELSISATYHDTLAETEEYRWCCHARFCLSASLTDGTVPIASARTVQQYAEKKAKEQKLKGVTTIIISQSFADLASNFTYRFLQEDLPEIQETDMSHLAACLRCDESFGKQCEAQVEREFQNVPEAESLLNGVWCSHAVCALADILIDRENGKELLGKIIPFAEQVAQEKGYPGVTTRCLFIALGRMLGS